MSIPGSSSVRPWKMSRSSCTCTSSPQSVGGPRAEETGGGSSGSPRCVRIFRIGPGSRTGCPQQPEVANSAKARDGFALVKQFERNQPDVAATVRALKRKLLPHPGQQFRPCNPRGVVRTGLVMRVAAASRGMPTGHSLTPLADVPDGERGDGGPQLVIRREYSVNASGGFRRGGREQEERDCRSNRFAKFCLAVFFWRGKYGFLFRVEPGESILRVALH